MVSNFNNNNNNNTDDKVKLKKLVIKRITPMANNNSDLDPLSQI